ncbi:CILP1-like protein [Mya arenaria]|uniref:CILP1-like protein n=1 Tax=Mya arenaria TaxID=6604 RepID=A0ABY7G3P4_MYAAR|nr:CILP1-like protein [Mya arenaria]
MDFPKGIRRVVATFHDPIFKKFTDVTKVIEVNEGSDTFATIVVPLKPVPIPFASNNGTEINLGGNKHTPPAAKLSIQPDSIVTADGKTFNGNVKASLHFMDPRNRDDMDAANGNFESEGPDGSKVPLSTFGMFKFDMTDDNGTDLTVTDAADLRIIATSFIQDTKGDQFGSYDVGPIPDPRKDDITMRERSKTDLTCSLFKIPQKEISV